MHFITCIVQNNVLYDLKKQSLLRIYAWWSRPFTYFLWLIKSSTCNIQDKSNYNKICLPFMSLLNFVYLETNYLIKTTLNYFIIVVDNNKNHLTVLLTMTNIHCEIYSIVFCWLVVFAATRKCIQPQTIKYIRNGCLSVIP